MQNGNSVRVIPRIFAFFAIALLTPAFGADETVFVSTQVHGYEEVPTRSTPATGQVRVTLVNETTLNYELSYTGFTTAVREAHIHLGAARVNGGVMVFLCSNLGTAPANTPACPANDGSVSGTLTLTQVVGPSDQGIAPGEFGEVLAALRANAAYVNIHTEQYPAGEIRDQVLPEGTDDEDDLRTRRQTDPNGDTTVPTQPGASRQQGTSGQQGTVTQEQTGTPIQQSQFSRLNNTGPSPGIANP